MSLVAERVPIMDRRDDDRIRRAGGRGRIKHADGRLHQTVGVGSIVLAVSCPKQRQTRNRGGDGGFSVLWLSRVADSHSCRIS